MKRPEARRDELLAAAVALFQERTVDDVTVADISAAAGAAKGTFYLYFESREALVEALQRDFLADLLEVMTAAGQRSGGGRMEAVAAEVDAAIEFVRRQARRYDALFGDTMGKDAVAAPVVGALAKTIEEGRAAGEFDVADPQMTAELLYAALGGAINTEIHRRRPQWARLKRAADQLVTRALVSN